MPSLRGFCRNNEKMAGNLSQHMPKLINILDNMAPALSRAMLSQMLSKKCPQQGRIRIQSERIGSLLAHASQ